VADLAADVLKFVASVGALSWLTKSLLTHWLSKDLDAHKERLAAHSALELERLKAELHAAAKEREIRFAALHARRAEGIARLYGSYVQLTNKAVLLDECLRRGQLGAGALFLTELIQQERRAGELTSRYRLHLESALADKLDAFRRSFIGHLIRGLEKPEFPIRELSEERARALMESWAARSVEFETELRGIETQFRRVLGSELQATLSPSGAPDSSPRPAGE
jgi:hypothetical protein